MKNYFTDDPGVIPKTVRLAFHHCMGGCDGCIAFEAVLNRGLVWYIQEQGTNSKEANFGSINRFKSYFDSETYLLEDLRCHTGNGGKSGKLGIS